MNYEKILHKAKNEDLTKLIDFLDIEKTKKNPLLFFEKPELLEEVLKDVYYIKKKDFGKIIATMLNNPIKLRELNDQFSFRLEYYREKNWIDQMLFRKELSIKHYFIFLNFKTNFLWEIGKTLEKEDKVYFEIFKREKTEKKTSPWIEPFIIQSDWFFKSEHYADKILKKLSNFYDELSLNEFSEKEKIIQATREVGNLKDQWKELCCKKIKEERWKEVYKSIKYNKDFTLLKLHEHVYKKIDLTDLFLSWNFKKENTKELLLMISEESKKARLILKKID